MKQMLVVNLEKSSVHKEIRQGCQGKSGVYQITNLQNRKKYIGSAATKSTTSNRLYVRFRNHFFHQHADSTLKRAIKKWGISSFSWQILEWTPAEEATNRESWYIKELRPEYNILQTGGSSLGYIHTPLSKEKMKASYSPERRETIGLLYRGKVRSLESREKMSAAAKEREAAGRENQRSGSTLWNRKAFSKETEIWQGDAFFGRYSSLRQACDAWGGDYGTFKRAVKSGKKIGKYNIYVKYCS